MNKEAKKRNQKPIAERCSGFTTLPITHELDAPQPLVDRKPSVSLLRWNNYNYNGNNNNNNIRVQNEFNPLLETIDENVSPATYGYPITGLNAAIAWQANFGGAVVPGSSAARTEPISLAALDRDCFIIPVHSVDRFLPAGIPLPPTPVDGSSGTKASSPLSVLEVSDPKMCILVHLMSPLEPIDPVLESPLAHPLLKQRTVASELVSEVQQANTAMGGMLLANMEKSSEFPFIAYYAINTTQTDPSSFYSGIRVSSLSKFEPKNLKYTAAHTLDLYSEVAAICRPPLVLGPSDVGGFKKTQTPATGYIISVFKVFEGDDGERFEKNWLYWTGARMLYSIRIGNELCARLYPSRTITGTEWTARMIRIFSKLDHILWRLLHGLCILPDFSTSTRESCINLSSLKTVICDD
ncbi:uncharacterized protein ACN427_000634 isoform 5-T8 [Glossina fuscipes fuscipes]